MHSNPYATNPQPLTDAQYAAAKRLLEETEAPRARRLRPPAAARGRGEVFPPRNTG
jgi:hypothetical protein